MAKLVSVVLFGQSGAGKSRLGNTLLEFNICEEARFIGRSSEKGGQAFGCQYLPARIDFQGESYTLHIVNTPGIFQDNVTAAEKNWEDVVKAFDKSDMKVNVFVIVLKASELKKSEEVIQSFVDFFGVNAPLNSVVVFTHIGKETTERKILFEHYQYLQRHLRFGFLYLLWKDDDPRSNVNKLMEMVAETNKLKPYTNREFSEAQMEFTKKWISDQKTQLPRKTFSSVADANSLVDIGIPAKLIKKILSEEQTKILIRLTRK